MPITISGLFYYPVKSCAGIRLARADFDERGIRFDRRWMVTDERGLFLSQRNVPGLCRIRTAQSDGSLVLSAPGAEDLALPLRRQGSRVEVVVWRDRCMAHDQGNEVAQWISGVLGRPCRLVRMTDDHARPIPGVAAGSVAFSDGYPLLIVSEASLADLNTHLAAPVPMDRFRPNLVVSGCRAFAEDTWDVIRVGPVMIRLIKPCERCVVTTTDQTSGARISREPLSTLSRYRRIMTDRKKSGGVIFGMNAAHVTTGTIRVGDNVVIGSRRTPPLLVPLRPR